MAAAPEWWQYLLVVLATTGACAVLTPVALRLAVRIGALDRPGPRKLQARPVPYFGGLPIVATFTAVVLAATVVHPPVSGRSNVAMLLAIGLGLSVLGVIDDLRDLPRWPRVVVEALAGLAVFESGTGVALTPTHWVNAVLTVLWVVGIVNAFNLLDNMDGLSAGLAALAAVCTFGIALLNGQYLVATLALALVGCALGFLPHNFHPARIHMGDAGSLYLGYLLAVLTLRLRTHSAHQVSLAVPLLLLGVAWFDTGLVVFNRLLHRRPVLPGARDHTSHRLVHVGIPVPVAVGVIYAAGAAVGGLAVVAALLNRVMAFVLLGWAAGLGVAAFALLSAVPIYSDAPRSTELEAVRPPLRAVAGGVPDRPSGGPYS